MFARPALVLLALAAATGAARADKGRALAVRGGAVTLPGGVSVSLADCALRARRGVVDAVIATFEADPSGDCPAVASARLLAGGALVVTTGPGERRTIARGHIDSRLDLAAARRAPAEAEKLLERALAADPAFEDAALELASTRLRLKRVSSAVDAVRPFLGRAPVRFYARVLADRRVAALVEQPAFAAVRAATPGTAQLANAVAPFAAYAPERRLFALLLRRKGLDAERTDLLLFDGRALVAELPLIDEQGGRRRAWRLVANRMLRDFGFAVPAGLEQGAFARRNSGADAVRFPRARLGIGHAEGAARLFEGGAEIASRRLYRACDDSRRPSHLCEYPPVLDRAFWLPDQRTALLIWATSGAEWNQVVTVVEVWPLGGQGGRIVLPASADPETPPDTGSI